jgi:VWFA-related protein
VLTVAIAAPLFLLAFAKAQTSDAPLPTLHAETRVVQIDVVVVDSNGKPVEGLTKQDFVVSDEGKARTIDIFNINRAGEAPGDQAPTPVAAVPSSSPTPTLPPHVFSNQNPGRPDVSGHSTVLVLDQINAYLEDAAYARGQVLNLIKKVPADERIALYVISRNLGLVLLQDYTTDRELILRSLGKYIPRGIFPSPPIGGSKANKSGDSSPVGNTVAQADEFAKGTDQSHPPGLANTIPPPTLQEKIAKWEENSRAVQLVLKALAEHLALVPGRKSVFWITQGFPPGLLRGTQQPAWDKTFTELNEANVAVNTVDSRGLWRGSNPNTGTLLTMQTVADATGGKAYFGRNDLDTAMADGIAASRVSYTLGFYLDDKERDDKFHALHVRVARAGLQLFYRQGYYAGSSELPGGAVPTAHSGDLEAALMNQTNATGVGMTARVEPKPGSPQGTLDIFLNLDPATLSLAQHGAGWIGRIEEMFVEVNEDGETLAKISDTKEFEVPASGRARFDSEGVAWPLSLPLIPGAKKITIVLRDRATGHVGSLAVPIL